MKFRVYAMYSGTKYLGEFEADDAEAAKEQASETGDEYMTLCHQCADQIELGDCHEYLADPVQD